MSEQFTPSTEEVRDEYIGKLWTEGEVKDWPDDARERIGAEFDRWLAKRDAEVAAKAWDEGRRAEELSWRHVFDGHPVPEGEMCDECAVENPYRKVVQS